MIMNSEERTARLYVLFKHSWWHQLITTSVAPMMEDLNYECPYVPSQQDARLVSCMPYWDITFGIGPMCGCVGFHCTSIPLYDLHLQIH